MLDSRKYAPGQWQEMKELSHSATKLRIMAFNVLFDIKDNDLAQKHRWPNRLPHVLQTIKKIKPDVFAVQEPQLNQTKDLKEKLNDYAFISSSEVMRSYRPKENLDDGIFYNKDRIKLVSSGVLYVSPPGIKLKFPLTVQIAHFKDKSSGKTFGVIATHMDYFSPTVREHTAALICKLANEYFYDQPVIALGDFNLFPHRPDKEFPFYDAEYIERKFCDTCNLKNSRRLAVFGHLGPLSTFTNSEQDMRKPFSGLGVPGVELDQIYVRGNNVSVLSHVTYGEVFPNNEYASDHFPVFIDLVFK